jgi:shikimate kinase
MNAADVNLYLVGFMGTGKTTVGRAAAQRLDFAYVDSDHEIERIRGKTVAEIFADEGEQAFRAMEREFVASGHPPARAAVACGGGLVIQPGLAEQLRSRGVVICLHASIETILARTGRQTHRPLLAGGDPEERLRALFAERDPIYRSAGTLILTDGRPLKDIVGHVVRVWRREAADFARASGSTAC